MAKATDCSKKKSQKTTKTSDVLLLRYIRINSTIVQQDKGEKIDWKTGSQLLDLHISLKTTPTLPSKINKVTVTNQRDQDFTFRTSF